MNTQRQKHLQGQKATFAFSITFQDLYSVHPGSW